MEKKYHFFYTKASLLFLTVGLCHANVVAPHDKCEVHLVGAEKKHSLPKHSLLAVALTESGYSSNGKLRPHPWTICKEGKTYYYKTRAEAVKAAQQFIRQGHRNLDFGCMQINYRHHGDKFKSVADMFEPQKNVSYAAAYLAKVIKKKPNWREAIAYYNSSNPLYQVPYRKKVLAYYDKIRKGDFADLVGSSVRLAVNNKPQPKRPAVSTKIVSLDTLSKLGKRLYASISSQNSLMLRTLAETKYKATREANESQVVEAQKRVRTITRHKARLSVS